MIDKIMKSVKRENKKRSLNITIGAVVGFLLSCTAVMGADEGIDIGYDVATDKITVKKEYEENVKEDNSYTNNAILTETGLDGSNYFAVKIGMDNNSEKINFANNGYINFKKTDKTSNGIYISGNTIKLDNLINNGMIEIESTLTGYYTAIGIMIDSNSAAIELLKNSGNIKSSEYGIKSSGGVKELLNIGLIYGATGISSSMGSPIEKLINKGVTTGTGNIGRTSGAIMAEYGSNKIGKVENLGILSGDYIFSSSSGGKIDSADNYGLMAGNNLIYYSLDEKNLLNYGLAVKFDESKGTYELLKETAETPQGSPYTVRNIELQDGKQLDSFYLAEEKNDSHIYNGLEDTLIVSGKNNELTNSVVNAYRTSLVMKGEEIELKLNATQVNGGIDETSATAVLEGNWNKLTAENESSINGNLESTGNYNTISVGGESTVNGDIKIDGKWNTLTVDNSIVNGEMTAVGSKNTLNLYGRSSLTKASTVNDMNINHDITGFGRIQIKNNVTLSKGITVSGTDRINILDGGVLSLGLNEVGTDATHALSGNTGITISGEDTEGTLKFLVGGLTENTVNVGMEGIVLEGVNLKTSNVIYNIGDIDDAGIEIVKAGGVAEILSGEGKTFDQYSILSNIDYNSLDGIYKSAISSKGNTTGIIEMIDSATGEEQIEKLLSYLGNVYTESPYSYSSELSRRSMGMFRDIVTENQFKPNLDKWLIMGGFTHADGGTKDTYYGKNSYVIDSGYSSTKADMKLTGAYALGKYGYSENLSLGVTVGGNRSEAEMSMSKVKGNSGYIGAFAENYRGNLTLKAGAGIQYSEYDADRRTIGGHSYDEKYSDMAYDIYLNGRYSNPIGDNLFLEPYGTLSYTYVDQEGVDEGDKVLAIETDSKSFDYTTAKVGVDLKKVIPHEKGKSTVSAGVSYTRILDGADEESITGRFKGGSDFDILVAHKNEHSIGLNAKYSLELENGILFDVKGTYAVERDSHNQSGKNKNKGEWIVGAGLGYKF